MSKINQLIKGWQRGTVRSSDELKRLGYSSQILKVYANSGWISLLSRGAYILSGDDVHWPGGLYCLHRGTDNCLHVGGKTALELKGFAHYISQQNSRVEWFGNVRDKLPMWFTKQPWMKNIHLVRTEVFPYENHNVFTITEVQNISIRISSPELAIMEMLLRLPQVHSFDETSLIMESLTTLRSDLVQNLLENCNSIKVKRLFLFLAEKHHHGWFEELDTAKINLGSGKREIVKNGKLNRKYGITIPGDYEEQSVF
jgi:hypothetical protein